MNKKLLPLLSVGLVSIAFVACGSKTTAPVTTTPATSSTTTTTTPAAPAVIDFEKLPFDFPEVKVSVKAGDTVLAPSRSMIDSAIKSGGAGTYIFYNSTVVEPGTKATKVKEIIDNTVIPNALVLPIKAGQTAKTGDIVLTWWQSGSGLQRAYVVEGGATPKVAYLDGKNLGTATLKADTFNVLSADWQQGTTVACKDRETDKYKQFTLINSAGDMALLSGWAGSLTTMTKSRCVAVPLKTDVKVGDKVYASVYSEYKEVTVSSVDKANGKIKAKYEFAGSTTEEEFSFGSILTAMPA